MTSESTDITLGGRLELYPSTVQVLRMAGWTPPGEPTPEHAACVPRAEYEHALKTQAERHATRVALMPNGMSEVSIKGVMASTRQLVVDEIVRAIDESELHFDAGALSKKLLLDLIRLHDKK